MFFPSSWTGALPTPPSTPPTSDKSNCQFIYQPNSPLLSLPAELRLQIYSYLLTPPHIHSLQQLSLHNYVSDYVLPPLDIHPALLRVSKQINYEATEYLYERHTFTAHPRLLTKMPFLVKSSRPVLHNNVTQRIRKWRITVRLDNDPGYTSADVKAAFTGVEALSIRAWQSMFEACDCTVLRLFEDVRGVGEAKVEGSVSDGYARWLEQAMMTDEDIDEDIDDALAVVGHSNMRTAGRSKVKLPFTEETDKKYGSYAGARPGYDIWTHGGR